MAFNPFNWFRKHQKLFFAGLVVICMFVFIAQVGQGDIFSRITDWMRQSGGRGPAVTTVNGRKVTEGDLQDLLAHRRAANAFVEIALSRAMFPASSKLALGEGEGAEKDPKTPTGRLKAILTPIQPFLSFIANEKMDPRVKEQVMRQLGPMLMRPDPTTKLTLEQQFRQEVASFHPTSRDKAEQAAERRKFLAVADRVGAVLGFLMWEHARRTGPFYFGGDGTAESLIDFIIWQQQADKLGITLTDADVMREINTRAGGYSVFNEEKPNFDNEALVAEFVKGYRPHVPAADLLKAIKDEIRVAMARSLVLGYSDGDAWRAETPGTPNANPAVLTPYEFFRRYRELRTTRTVRLVPLAVEPFLKEVKGKPSSGELQALFDKYKGREPQPDDYRHGFKEPRRVRVEYVVGSPADKYFQQKAHAAVYGTNEKGKKPTGGLIDHGMEWRRAYNVVQNVALTPLGAGPLGRALAVIGGPMSDPLLLAHGKYVKATESAQPILADLAKDLPVHSEFKPGAVDLASALQPRPLAEVVRQRMLAGATGNPFQAVTPLYLAGTVDNPFLPDEKTLKKEPAFVLKFSENTIFAGPVRQELSAILAPAVAQPGMESLFGMPALVLAHRHARGKGKITPAPRYARAKNGEMVMVMERAYLAEAERRYAAALLMVNVQEFAAKVESYKGKQPPGKDVLREEAARLHLAYHSTPRPMSGAAITDELHHKADLGLEPLRKALEEPGRPLKPEDISGFLLAPTATFEPWALTARGLAPWDAKSAPQQEQEGKPRLLYWVSESEKAREPRNFAEVAKKVREAWELDRARALARDRAAQIVKKINDSATNARDAGRLLAELRERDRRLGEPFELEGVAQLIAPSRENLAGRKTEYLPYVVEGSARERMPYPPNDLTRQLVPLKRLGQAMRFADRPARHEYIAVLEAYSPPTLEEMRSAYDDAKADRAGLYDDILSEKRAEYTKAVMKQLRKQAGLTLNSDGEADIPEDTKKRFPSNPRSQD